MRKSILAAMVVVIFISTLSSLAMATDKEVLISYMEKRLGYSLEYITDMFVDEGLVGTSQTKVKGAKMYMASVSQGISSYVINDGEYIYLWTSMTNIGKKSKVEDYKDSGELSKNDITGDEVTVRILGRENANGFECMKVEIIAEGRSQYHWISEEYGVSVRIIMDNVRMDVTRIERKDIPDSTFVPPSYIDFSGSMSFGLGQAVAQAAKDIEDAMAEARPVTKEEFLGLIAKRGSIPAIYTERYDNVLKTKVTVSVKAGFEYRMLDAAVKLYLLYDGKDFYTWNSMIKTVSKVKSTDAAVKLLSPYDPTIMYAKDFTFYEYLGRDSIMGEMCRGALVLYGVRTYEIWVSERLGILMRMIVDDVDMTVIGVTEKDVPDSTFQLPSGYKVK
ncbi:MAG: hypothetical protein BWY00_01402 [Firmicutes bacterium ADurb.Bin153]|nr:MAG: hypothetical protein BWY00_01402 [Firmicutes bacterium ADurb.Bin153]